MRTLNTYLARNMFATMLMALGIMTFVMLSGHFYRAFDMLSQGVSPLVLVKFIVFMLPYTLCFTLPLALLVATVLVFSRLSADNEIVAMKSMGISLWQIVTPSLLLSIATCGVCLWISLFVAPQCRFLADQLMTTAAAETPLAMLEPGAFTELFSGCEIRIGERDGSTLKDVHIVLRDKKGHAFKDIVAASGSMSYKQGDTVPELVLSGAEVTDFRLDDKPSPTDVSSIYVGTISMPLDFQALRASRRISRKERNMDFRMMCARIVLDEEDGKDVTEHIVNLHKRIAMSIAPFSFFLLGLPFGVKSRRSEMSVGLLLCVLLALVFYAFILLTDSVKSVSGLHPQYIIWIPNLLYQFVGIALIRKLEFRG